MRTKIAALSVAFFGFISNVHGQTLQDCGMVWVRDEHRADGIYSIWKPSRPVAIVVNVIRHGKMTGQVTHALRPAKDELAILITKAGVDEDGIADCKVTL